MIKISDSARSRLEHLLGEKPGYMFRVGLRAGGCAGFEQVFELTDRADKFDHLITISDKIVLLIDQKSAKLLGDATLDWTGDLLGKRFEIKSANKKTSCGCGSSFSI